MSEFRFELRRAFRSPGFIISLLTGMALCIADIAVYSSTYRGDHTCILIKAWIGTDYAFVFNGTFYTLFPIIACLPYGASYFRDIHSGYDRNLLVRVSRKNYMISKMAVSFIMGFLAVSIPLLMDLFICAGLYPNLPPEKLQFMTAGVLNRSMFAVIFHTKPLLYILLYIFIDGMSGGLLNLVSMAVAPYSGSVFTVTVMPFALYLAEGVAFQSLHRINLSVLELVNPLQDFPANLTVVSLMYAGILVICVCLIAMHGRKRDVL